MSREEHRLSFSRSRSQVANSQCRSGLRRTDKSSPTMLARADSPRCWLGFHLLSSKVTYCVSPSKTTKGLWNQRCSTRRSRQLHGPTLPASVRSTSFSFKFLFGAEAGPNERMDTTLLRRFGRKNLGEFGLFETRLGRCNRRAMGCEVHRALKRIFVHLLERPPAVQMLISTSRAKRSSRNNHCSPEFARPRYDVASPGATMINIVRSEVCSQKQSDASRLARVGRCNVSDRRESDCHRWCQ